MNSDIGSAAPAVERENIEEIGISKGMSVDGAKEFANSIIQGSSAAKDMIKAGIIEGASALAAAQAGARTGGDLRNIEASGGTEGFIQAARLEGAKKGTVSKVQNIDMLSQEKSQNYVDDINREVIQHRSPQKRAEMVDRMKEAGMLTEDSDANNMVATSGEKFAIAQAKLAAGAMDRSERFAIGDTSISSVRDVATGHARIEARQGNVFTDGDEVNHNHGVNYKNPIQYLSKQSGVDTTKGGTEDGTMLDSIADNAVLGIAGAAVLGSGYAVANKMTGGALSAGYNAAKHKAMGHIEGKDKDGKGGVYYSDKNWETLKNKGMAQHDKEGNWELKEDRGKAKDFITNQPSSAGKDQNFQIDNKINPINTPTKNAVMSDSFTKDIPNYNTNEEISTKKDALLNEKDFVVGKNGVNAALEGAKNSFPQGSAEHIKASQLQEKVAAGLPVNAEEFNTLTGANAPKSKTGDIDLNAAGKSIKSDALDAFHAQETKFLDPIKSSETPKTLSSAESFEQRHAEALYGESGGDSKSTSSASDTAKETHGGSTPKSKLGKVLSGIGILGFGASAADASSNFMSKTDDLPTEEIPMNSADAAAVGTQVGFNALNAFQGYQEIKVKQ